MPSRRRTARPSRSVYVFAEGKRTEPQYLVHWSRLYRASVVVTIDPLSGCDPRTLVEAARSRKKKDDRQQRRGRGSAYDQYWCVFDRDEHARWDEALQMATDNGIQVAVSNPCIELWFLLHFEDHQRWIERGRAQSKARQYLAGSKTVDASAFGALRDEYETARARALSLEAKHKREGNGACGNPSSGMWRLIDYIVGGEPVPA